MLEESDFNDTLVNPMENKEEIVIEVYIENYSNNKTILTVFQDATVKNEKGKEVLKLTYRFFPYMPETSTSIRTMTTAFLSMRGKPTMRR